jgi:hypothetical protein
MISTLAIANYRSIRQMVVPMALLNVSRGAVRRDNPIRAVGRGCSFQYLAKKFRKASTEQQADIKSLCHNIFRTVAQIPDDVEAGKRIDELMSKAKADDEIKRS